MPSSRFSAQQRFLYWGPRDAHCEGAKGSGAGRLKVKRRQLKTQGAALSGRGQMAGTHAHARIACIPSQAG